MKKAQASIYLKLYKEIIFLVVLFQISLKESGLIKNSLGVTPGIIVNKELKPFRVFSLSSS